MLILHLSSLCLTEREQTSKKEFTGMLYGNSFVLGEQSKQINNQIFTTDK